MVRGETNGPHGPERKDRMRLVVFVLAALAVPVAGCATTREDLRQQELLNDLCRKPDMPGTVKCIMDKKGCYCTNFDILNPSLGISEQEWVLVTPQPQKRAAR